METLMPRPIFLGEFEQLVISILLLIEDEPYALRLREELSRVSGRAVSRGALYRTLDRLERKKYVAVAVEKGGPDRRGHLRRRYRVTAGGRAVLRASRDTWMGIWRDVAEVLG
jgi:DNA-binding PadR family transcriptional regulator